MLSLAGEDTETSNLGDLFGITRSGPDSGLLTPTLVPECLVVVPNMVPRSKFLLSTPGTLSCQSAVTLLSACTLVLPLTHTIFSPFCSISPIKGKNLRGPGRAF